MPGRSGKLRGGAFYVRGLRAHWRAAPASRARFRHSAKKSRAVPKNAIARGLELIDWVMRKAEQLREKLGGTISQDNVPKPPQDNMPSPPAAIETAVEIISASSQPIQQGKPPVIEPVPAAPPPLRKKRRRDDRVLIAAAPLELAIAAAVKQAAPGCEAFVGVIVRQTTPKSRVDANWALPGIRFGTADRAKVNEAMATIVERMQREFRLSEQATHGLPTAD